MVSRFEQIDYVKYDTYLFVNLVLVLTRKAVLFALDLSLGFALLTSSYQLFCQNSFKLKQTDTYYHIKRVYETSKQKQKKYIRYLYVERDFVLTNLRRD